MKYTTFVKKAMNRRDQKQQLKTSEKNYNNKKKKEQKQRQNLQKIRECTKKEKKICEAEILKLKHERDTAEEVMKALRNANFNKYTSTIQISSVTDKEQQTQKLNAILEKEQGMKKMMAKDNIELKAQNQTLQTKMQENHEKYDDDLKILHKAKEELSNQNKEQNQQLKRLLAEKDQHTKTTLNTQSINNELEQQVISFKRVNLG